jgi:hypothetical protein
MAPKEEEMEVEQQIHEEKDLKTQNSNMEYPVGLRLVCLMFSIFAAMFLVILVSVHMVSYKEREATRGTTLTTNDRTN